MDCKLVDNTCESHQQINNDDCIQQKLITLENENKKIREEFNGQRGKMKELFLQKEGECKQLTKQLDEIKEELNEAKSQILVTEYKKNDEIKNQDRKAQEEIASLQQLVHETIEESSYSKAEINRLLEDNEKLRCENNELRELVVNYQQQPLDTTISSNSLAPVIDHVKKTIVRKLGVESIGGGGGNNSHHNSNDNLEDSMRKVNKYAQEDAEVLRSLVVPLETEIKALKEKIRTTDDELQHYRGLKTSESALVGMLNESKSQINMANQLLTEADDDCVVHKEAVVPTEINCETCRKCEAQLKSEKESTELLRKDIERYKEELNRESTLRTDLEKQWNEKRDLHKEEVQKLTEQIRYCDDNFEALQKSYSQYKNDINIELQSMTAERETIHRHLETLQNDNEYLAGKYLQTSNELSNQRIDLPNNVNDLHELLLKCHENLISARVGCEFEQRKSMSYFDETQLLRDQLQAVYDERNIYTNDVTQRIESLEQQLKEKDSERLKLINLNDNFEQGKNKLDKESSELRSQVIELSETNDKLKQNNRNLKDKMSVLHQELKNSEDVQKDFVRLSQSLQMELEKIRAADTSVRWQYDEDVVMCPSCKTSFAVTRRKQHCLHCGTIYCEKCLTKTVPSGPRKKPAPVCDVCHTLLNRDMAPYFSQAPPQSPS